jgi:transmembrane sensor
MDHPGQHNRYDELAKKLFDGTISDAERREYFDWLDKEEEEPLELSRHFATDETALKNRIYGELESVMHQTSTAVDTTVAQPIPSIPVSRKWYRFAAAAAILIFVAVAAWLWTTHKNDRPALATADQPLIHDALPGRNGAILTLANGRQVMLDSLANGAVARQGNTDVVIRNGQLVYNDLHGSNEILYNTMTTSRGRQYQLILPDGSKVWLNAASSITYPTSFTEKQRVVKITGEAYFEVASLSLTSSGGEGKGNSSASHGKVPFIVDVDGKQTVEVLGTHFNINSYNDEGSIRTTLLEGKVKVSAASGSRLLQPGEQATLFYQSQKSHKILVQTVDVEQVMAWKNGLFQFEETSLELVLKQLERWYDIEVVFEGKIPQESFVGELPRNAPLSQILRALEKTRVKFRIEGKKLIVMS